MKWYFAFTKAHVLLKPHHQICWCHIRTLVEGYYPVEDVQSVYSAALADWTNIQLILSSIHVMVQQSSLKCELSDSLHIWFVDSSLVLSKISYSK